MSFDDRLPARHAPLPPPQDRSAADIRSDSVLKLARFVNVNTDHEACLRA